jgi:hypothetical protein
MAWFAFDRNSACSLENSPTISKGGIRLRDGNALVEALAAKESVLLLPGTVADSPFLLHIRNRRGTQPAQSRKKWWRFSG